MTDHHHLGVEPSTDATEHETDRALATGVRALVWDGDDDFLRARIQRSRASGARVLLPRVPALPAPAPAPSRTRRSWRQRVLVAGGGLAAFLLLSLVVERAPRSSRTAPSRMAPTPVTTASDTSTEERSESLAELLAPWPRLAFAQAGVGMPAPYPPVRISGSARVRPSDRAYIELVAPAAGEALVPLDAYVESVRADTTHHDRAWLVSREYPFSEDQHGRQLLNQPRLRDSLWVDMSTLRPREQHLSAGDPKSDYHMQYVVRFEATRFESVYRYKTRSEELRMLPDSNKRGPYWVIRQRRTVDSSRVFIPFEGAMALLLQALPLADGWRGSVLVPEAYGALSETAALLPLNLRVDGVDTVAVFRDRYPSWRVLVENGPRPEIWHVRQRTGEVLLVERRDLRGALRARRYLTAGLVEPDSGRVGGPAR